jgi:hypothetical protein
MTVLIQALLVSSISPLMCISDLGVSVLLNGRTFEHVQVEV